MRIITFTAALVVLFTPLSAFAQASSASSGGEDWGGSWQCGSGGSCNGALTDYTEEYNWPDGAGTKGSEGGTFTDESLPDSDTGVSISGSSDTAGAGDITVKTNAGYGFSETADGDMPGDMADPYASAHGDWRTADDDIAYQSPSEVGDPALKGQLDPSDCLVFGGYDTGGATPSGHDPYACGAAPAP